MERNDTHDNNPSDSKEQLAAALRNPVYEQYALGEKKFGSLQVDELPKELVESSEFRHIVSAIDWPDDIDNKNVAPPYIYGSASEFIGELFYAEQFAGDLEADGLNHDADVVRKKGLNNLNSYLSAEPIRVTEDGRREDQQNTEMSSPYETLPALLRAQIVAPDLFDALRTELQKAPTRTEREALFSERPDLVAGAYVAYRILGRLVKTDDKVRHAKLANYPGDYTDLEDYRYAHAAVTQ